MVSSAVIKITSDCDIFNYKKNGCFQADHDSRVTDSEVLTSFLVLSDCVSERVKQSR